jgi:hypothetical protein
VSSLGCLLLLISNQGNGFEKDLPQEDTFGQKDQAEPHHNENNIKRFELNK